MNRRVESLLSQMGWLKATRQWLLTRADLIASHGRILGSNAKICTSLTTKALNLETLLFPKGPQSGGQCQDFRTCPGERNVRDVRSGPALAGACPTSK